MTCKTALVCHCASQLNPDPDSWKREKYAPAWSRTSSRCYVHPPPIQLSPCAYWFLKLTVEHFMRMGRYQREMLLKNAKEGWSKKKYKVEQLLVSKRMKPEMDCMALHGKAPWRQWTARKEAGNVSMNERAALTSLRFKQWLQFKQIKCPNSAWWSWCGW